MFIFSIALIYKHLTLLLYASCYKRATVRSTTDALTRERVFDLESNPILAINGSMGSFLKPIQIFSLVIYFELGSRHFSH